MGESRPQDAGFGCGDENAVVVDARWCCSRSELRHAQIAGCHERSL